MGPMGPGGIGEFLKIGNAVYKKTEEPEGRGQSVYSWRVYVIQSFTRYTNIPPNPPDSSDILDFFAP